MIQLSEDHSDISVIGVGAHRACYIHPDDPQKCIKIIYNPSDIALKEIKRDNVEYAEAQRLRKRRLQRRYG